MIKNRVRLISLLVIELFLCIFYHNITFELMLIVSIVLPTVSIIQLKEILKKTTIDLKITKKVIGKEKKTDVIISVDNKTNFPISEYNVELKIYNEFYKKVENYVINIPIGAKSNQEIKFDISSSLYGNVNVEIYEIEVYDMLRLKKSKKNINIKEFVMIIPDIEQGKMPLEDFYDEKGDCENSFCLGEDPFEMVDVRNYVEGDKIQKIHWKLSLKQEDFMVKEYAMSYEEETNLVVELCDDEENVLDKIIENTFKIINVFAQKNERLFVSWFNDKQKSFFRTNIESEEDVWEAMREIYYTEIPKKEMCSYLAYCDSKENENAKALYLTNKKMIEKVEGNVIEKLGDDVVLMSI